MGGVSRLLVRGSDSQHWFDWEVLIADAAVLVAYEDEEEEEAQLDLAVELSTPVVVGKPAFRDR